MSVFGRWRCLESVFSIARGKHDEVSVGDSCCDGGKEISHVVIWVGGVGRGPDVTPLILDSHGGGVKDANGASIPCGIQLRPFRERSWYNESASHAIRILR